MFKDLLEEISGYTALRLAVWVISTAIGGLIVSKLFFGSDDPLPVLLGALSVPLVLIISAGLIRK